MTFVIVAGLLAVFALATTVALNYLRFYGSAVLCSWLTAFAAAATAGIAFDNGYILTGYSGSVSTFLCAALTTYMGIDYLCNRALSARLYFTYLITAPRKSALG